MEEKTFLITHPIDYKQQREDFISYLQQKQKDVNAGIEIYDHIMSFVGEPAQVFMKYSHFHHCIHQFYDKVKLKMRLYMQDDGNNALFLFKPLHEDFVIQFYVEFKSIYGDVEKMRIAKIARKIVAGGGAGIDFTIQDDDGKISCVIQGTPEKWEIIKKESTFKITRFNAEGYQDGMNNVNGERVFKEVDVDNVFEDAKESIDEIISYYSDDEDFLEDLANGIKINFDAVDANSSMLFAGWVRGKLTEDSEIEFNETFEVWSQDWSFQNLTFDSSVIATLSKTGENWYEDVFEWMPDDNDDEFAWEIHHEDLDMNYR